MRYALYALVALMVFCFLTSGISVSGSIAKAVYKLYIDGTASVTLFLNVPINTNVVNVSLEPGYIDGSALALTPNGTPLYVDIVRSMARIEVYNLTSKIIFTYNAYLGNVSENTLVVDLIHLNSAGLIILPKEAALVNASGSPQVSLSNSSISLTYLKPGTYKVVFAILPPISSTTSQVSVGGSSITQAVNTGRKLGFSSRFYSWLIGSLIILAAAVLAYFFIRRYSRMQVREFSIETGLDERDLMILKALREGNKSVSELSRALGLNKSVVWRRVKRLRSLGFLSMRVEKGKTIYGLTDLGIKALGKD